MLIDLDIPSAGLLERIGLGQYLLLSFEAELTFLSREHKWEDNMLLWPEFKLPTAAERLNILSAMFKNDTYFKEYGSCDSPEQFMTTDTARIIQESPMQFLVVFQHMDQETYGDRRWHKNGPHLGLKTPEYECFKDETEITEIYSFSVYRKMNQKSNPWDDFLHARSRALRWLRDKMKETPEQTAQTMSMDPLQVSDILEYVDSNPDKYPPEV